MWVILFAKYKGIVLKKNEWGFKIAVSATTTLKQVFRIAEMCVNCQVIEDSGNLWGSKNKNELSSILSINMPFQHMLMCSKWNVYPAVFPGNVRWQRSEIVALQVTLNCFFSQSDLNHSEWRTNLNEEEKLIFCEIAIGLEDSHK